VENEESLVAFCDAQEEVGVGDCVKGDLPHLREAGVTRPLL